MTLPNEGSCCEFLSARAIGMPACYYTSVSSDYRSYGRVMGC